MSEQDCTICLIRNPTQDQCIILKCADSNLLNLPESIKNEAFLVEAEKYHCRYRAELLARLNNISDSIIEESTSVA